MLKSVTSLTNFILSGQILEEFCPILFGANLTALLKKDGGIHPIAVGCVFRRLASKMACFLVKDNIRQVLYPKQLGFGIEGGCEAASHAIRSFYKTDQISDILVKIDIKNAFSSLDRGIILKQRSA